MGQLSAAERRPRIRHRQRATRIVARSPLGAAWKQPGTAPPAPRNSADAERTSVDASESRHSPDQQNEEKRKACCGLDR
jgi:hypothetical protein